MAIPRLIYRLTGLISVCLALVAAPLALPQRIAVLTALAIGVAVSTATSPPETFARRAPGMAVLVVALAPPSGAASIAALVALVVLGVASVDRLGMARIVPAAGLPVATMTLRSGAALDPVLVGGWLVAVVLTLILATSAWPVATGRPIGPSPTGRGDAAFDGRRLAHAMLTLLLVAPLSVGLADAIDTAAPAVLAAARPGDAQGRPFHAHPGLRGGIDAGMPVELGDEIVLRVKADQPRYWRGTTYDEWDGRSWSTQAQPASLSWAGSGVRLPAPPDEVAFDGLELPEPVTVTQRFTAERAGLDVLLGSWRIDAAYTSTDRADVGQDGSLRLDTPLGAGAVWTVVSQEVPATEDDLRRADPLLVPGGTVPVAQYATEDDVSPEVAALARTITADAPTTYDKIRAIESWMDRNLTYTRDIAVLSPGADAVDHLLFESRRGYCEQIGSALVVMLRSLGIPARLVVGYVPGEYDPSAGEWLSRASDAHAWAEVYFPGVGWRGFDPTAGVPTAVDEQPAGELDTGALVPIRAGIAGAVLLSITAVGLARRGRLDRGRLARFARRLPWPRSGAAAPTDALVDLHHRLDRCGARLGVSWPPTMTLRDRARSMADAGVDPASVAEVVRSLERATFGSDVEVSLDDPALAAAEAAMAELEAAVGEALSRAREPNGRHSERSPRSHRRDREPTPNPSRNHVP